MINSLTDQEFIVLITAFPLFMIIIGGFAVYLLRKKHKKQRQEAKENYEDLVKYINSLREDCLQTKQTP